MKLILKNTVDETVRSLNFNSFENYKNLFDEKLILMNYQTLN